MTTPTIPPVGDIPGAPAGGRPAAGRARGGWARAVLLRLTTSVLLLWSAVTVSFGLLHLTPGSVEDSLVGMESVSPEVRAEIVAAYGLDRSLIEQYGSYLGRLLRGDLGHSYQLHESVASAIGSRLGASLSLAVASMALALLVALSLAVLTARRARWLRSLSSGVELLGVSVPAFWVGILLLTVFSFELGWFPAFGGDGLTGLVLPAVAVAVSMTALLSQVLREGLELALDQPFVLTARSRGMSELAVRLRHALRHALLPVVTLAGWMFGALISSLVVIEQVFNRDGVGRLVLNAVASKDMPIVTGVVLLTAAVYIGINVLLDLLYPIIDPRLRGAS
ncbi:ABC transporter permease [Streptomyces marincola]|uniref:ABC transporter permease n=1 Tax=Streptomyces marincola TaxID=2878388 RepID=UPI001CF3293B|nr:ABC transporter permease [Streptomyces marincola]UCM87071.1 ABC transporter permease [Streptomyces marincola]